MQAQPSSANSSWLAEVAAGGGAKACSGWHEATQVRFLLTEALEMFPHFAGAMRFDARHSRVKGSAACNSGSASMVGVRNQGCMPACD